MNTFLQENSIWKVVLSNGETIISDNQYIKAQSDWARLKIYCLEHDLKIEKMTISFRDNIITIPTGTWYFFRRMALATFGKTGRVSDTYSYFLVGSTNDPLKIHLKKYLTPEMQCMEEEDRILEKDEPSLI